MDAGLYALASNAGKATQRTLQEVRKSFTSSSGFLSKYLSNGYRQKQVDRRGRDSLPCSRERIEPGKNPRPPSAGALRNTPSLFISSMVYRGLENATESCHVLRELRGGFWGPKKGNPRDTPKIRYNSDELR